MGAAYFRSMTSPQPFRPNGADSDRALDQCVRDALADAYGGVPDERLPEEWIRVLGAATRDGEEP